MQAGISPENIRAALDEHAIVAATNAKGRITYVNEKFCALSQYSPEELLGNDHRMINSGVHPKEFFAQMYQTIRSGQTWHGDICNRAKDGSLYWVASTIVPVKDAAQQITGFIALRTDITARKQAEEREHRLSRLYSALSHSNQAIVHSKTKEELFAKFCNAAVEFGGMRMAWIGIVDPVTKIVEPVASHGSGTEYLDGIQISADAAVPAGQGPIGIVIRTNEPYWCHDYLHDPKLVLWHERGKKAGWAASAALPISCNGAVIGIFGVYDSVMNGFDAGIQGLLIEMATDLSFALHNFARASAREKAERELRTSEAFTRAIADNVPAMLGYWTRDLRCTFANEQYRTWFGRSKESLQGIHMQDLLGSELFARNEPHIRAVLEGENQQFERSLTKPNGETGHAWAQYIAHRVNGVVEGFFVLVTDITQIRNAENLRQSLEVQLWQSQKMEALGTLAGGIAHDFNNIIAAILGNATLAAEETGMPAHSRESISEIIRAASRARDLVKQILSFSRRQPTRRNVASLVPVVEESVGLLRVSLPKNQQMHLHVAPQLPWAMIDSTQMQQVVLNLGTNAMQAMREHGGAVRVSLDTVAVDTALKEKFPRLRDFPSDSAIRLSVSDDGPGIAPENMERLFEPFFTTKPVNEGTGLGLPVVHGIVESHEGFIIAESTVGRGATFTVYLPPVDAVQAELPQPVPVRTQRTTPARVLFLDDEVSMVELVKIFLARRGYHVTGFTEPDEALAAVRTDPSAFDLVVSDSNLPGTSGLHFVQAVRVLRPGLRVALTSGYIDEVLVKRASAAGITELIHKADGMESFCDSLDRIMAKQ